MNKQIIADMILSELKTGVSKKTGNPLYIVNGMIVGCPDLPVLAGLQFTKFISEEVYKELCTLQQDRFDCSIGLGRSNATGKDDRGNYFDVAFSLFINGFPKEIDEPEMSGNVSQPPLPDAVDDKSRKGGK